MERVNPAPGPKKRSAVLKPKLSKCSIKKLLPILACPHCQTTLKSSGKQLVCLNKACKRKFPVKQGIPLLLPSKLEELQDSAFKKAQVEFFDEWSSESREKKEAEKTAPKHFFSPVVGEKHINYSEKAMRQLCKRIPKNSRVLELGCGNGEHTAFLAQLRPDIHLISLDLSLKSVLETQKRLKNEKIKTPVSLMVADAETLPFKNGAFVGIVIVMFFHHLAHLRKTLGEIKRTLHPEGFGLIVDLVANSPFITLPRKIFPHLPYGLKKRFKKDYLLENGEMPRVFPRKIKKIKQAVKKAKLKVIKEEHHDCFVFALSPLMNGFPQLRYLFPEFFLNFIYNIEKRLLRKRLFQRFAGAIVLWVSR